MVCNRMEHHRDQGLAVLSYLLAQPRNNSRFIIMNIREVPLDIIIPYQFHCHTLCTFSPKLCYRRLSSYTLSLSVFSHIRGFICFTRGISPTHSHCRSCSISPERWVQFPWLAPTFWFIHVVSYFFSPCSVFIQCISYLTHLYIHGDFQDQNYTSHFLCQPMTMVHMQKVWLNLFTIKSCKNAPISPTMYVFLHAKTGEPLNGFSLNFILAHLPYSLKSDDNMDISREIQQALLCASQA